MIKGKYKAAFIILKGVGRELTDDGWEFTDNSGFHQDTLTDIKDFLGDYVSELPNSVDKNQLKVEVFQLDDGLIESIYIRDYTSNMSYIEKIKGLLENNSQLELFVP
ncbi:hypothetical protein [Pseudoalteromonas sp. BSi20495]|uniref:hypothetical protein n=1 Tax=Pseudoalteromonas sp. BSi20495 TaxID=386429 RepID=UPI0002316039|nr:hypothetical protein [Pseudoalteromonas sp. BSi20495]GAA80693.1 hypothetical protein P20495_3208 [Pseudoalteromonas sp. BSi20495]